ncbi:hypothetical protein [Tenacibaculum finnmarkense]|uniref:hypothetical protein n=1 Tax=Tenacibaculum finnmarkense TaxID=2781243 RepID=UPI001E4B5D75|nr:hypothetical protein [Tenacibaculum finnmarkense]
MMNKTLPYGLPLEVGFNNVSDYELDTFSGERIRTYGVVTLFKTPKYTQKIQYEVTVTYLKKDIEKKHWIVQLEKTKVYINQANTERVIDKINEEFMLQVLYPIELAISSKGKLIGILNFEEITQRFNKFMTLKRKEYTGIYANRFFTLLEEKLESAYSLQTSMEKDWFWATFFNSVYFPKGYIGDKKVSKLFPSFNSYENCIFYNGEMKVSENYVRNNTISVTHKVASEKEGSCINIDYEINATSFLINEVCSNAQLINENKEVLKTIDVTIRHLREKDIKTEKAQKKEENKNRTIKQRFYKWLNT